MSAEQYAKHLEVVKKAFHRTGLDVADAQEVDLESISVLETILRVSSPEDQVLSDLPKGAFSADFYSEMRKNLFPDYLEYRALYLELSLDEYIGARYGLPEAVKSIDPTFVPPYERSPEVEEDEEILPEDLIDLYEGSGLVLFTVPYGVDEQGYDVWSDTEQEAEYKAAVDKAKANEERFRSLDLGDLSISDVLDPQPANDAQGIKGRLAYDPMGIDNDGYDIWHDTAYDSDEVSLVDEEVNTEPDTVNEIKGTDDPHGIWSGLDEDGYDVWLPEAEQHSSVTEDQDDEQQEASVADEEPVIHGTWHGIDELGYDIWFVEENLEEVNTFDSEGDSDGFDHTNDPERDVLGTLHSKWVGVDSDGHDIWESGDGIEPSIADVEVEEDNLKSPHYGIDATGYDIWTSPVAPSSTSNVAFDTPVSATSASQNTSSILTNDVGFIDRSVGEPLTTHAPLSREDQLLDVVDQAISGIFQFGKRLAGSKSRRNVVRSR